MSKERRYKPCGSDICCYTDDRDFFEKRNELVAKQQIEIEDLKKMLSDCKDNESKIMTLLYNVGGPLNGSALEYNRKQLEPFFSIARILE